MAQVLIEFWIGIRGQSPDGVLKARLQTAFVHIQTVFADNPHPAGDIRNLKSFLCKKVSRDILSHCLKFSVRIAIGAPLFNVCLHILQ